MFNAQLTCGSAYDGARSDAENLDLTSDLFQMAKTSDRSCKRNYVIHSSIVKHDHAANRRAADTAQGGQPQNRTALGQAKLDCGHHLDQLEIDLEKIHGEFGLCEVTQFQLVHHTVQVAIELFTFTPEGHIRAMAQLEELQLGQIAPCRALQTPVPGRC